MKNARILATAIAEELFMNGFREKAQRLVLTQDSPATRDLGGWSLRAAIEVIERVLLADALKES